MKEYKKLVKTVLKKGFKKADRTNTGTISYFGYQSRYDLEKGFPLLTTKKVYFKAIVHELLWFISGNTNIKYLVDNNTNIWNEWPYEDFKKSPDYKGHTLKEFVNLIKTDEEFAKKHGNLGPVYGKQWRNFEGIDQLKNLIEQIKNNPSSRRLIVSAWNPKDVDKMALPPCHSLFQFYVNDGYISLQLYQRSADIFLGVPFNIASYSLLLEMVAKQTNLKPKYFIHTLGDAHIYLNHIDQLKKQLKRRCYKLPKLILNDNVKSIFDYTYQDIKLQNYKHHGKLKGKVAV